MLINNTNKTIVESWFIPLNIFGIACLVLIIILTLIYLIIIIFDRTCHTVRMMLIANTCLTAFLCAVVHFAVSIYTLSNDFHQTSYQDSLCVFRGYLTYSTIALHSYSWLLSVIYQYMSIVYPARLFWKSVHVQLLLIILSWIFAFVYPIPFTVDGEIVYNVNNQICLLHFQLSFSFIYMPFCIYVIPLSSIIFIYMKLVRYVSQMSKQTMLANSFHRAQRDLEMVRRIVILLCIPFLGGFPMCIFAVLSFVNQLPIYYIRIGFIFIYVSTLLVMIILFLYTDLLQTSVKKMINARSNRVDRTLTVNPAPRQNKVAEKRIMGNIQTNNNELVNDRRINILT